jgi:hypothetical protein
MKNIVVTGDRNTNSPTKRINWRQILVHFIAAWLLTYASKLFGYFRDIPFLKVLMKRDSDSTLQYIKNRNWGTGDLVSYAAFVNETWIIGLLLAFIISLSVALIRHWWWMNSVIVIILVYVVNFISARFINNTTGQWFSTVYNFPIPASINSFIAVGILSTISSCLLFFSHKVVRLIEKPIQF